MELGNKIKHLRYKSGLTQEQLASRLGVSAQSVSKWENSVAMPDITLLPMLAGEFGVSIDELFDLTVEQKLYRIEKRIDTEEEFSADLFSEYEEFLLSQLNEYSDRTRVLSVLAHLYHYRMESDAQKVSKYAREAIMLKPEVKDCQWLLQMAEGERAWDWNVDNHSSLIDFYKNVIENDKITPKTPLPYYYLLDDLIVDKRTEEARKYLKVLKTIPAHKPFLIPVYEAYIALAEYNEKRADSIMNEALSSFSQNSGFLFETAQYFARKCQYDKAIEFYEKSWIAEENSKPRYTDALFGIATAYQIMGEKKKAVETYNRVLDCLKNEWGFSDDDRAVIETKRDRDKLSDK